ncbi:MAG: Ig-like domain-containing protein, partial [Saprospiraceae bacterium]
MHHVQVNRGDDDGMEWFGGAINADHLVVTNETDDSYDIDHGYSGTIDYMIAIQRVEAPRERQAGSTFPFEPVGDNVIECSSSQGGEPRKSFLNWSHLTLIDNGGAGGVMDAKEDCAGNYSKVVMVAGGITPDSASIWAFRAQGDFVIANITDPVPKLKFTDTFITGRYKKLIDVSALGVRNHDDSLAQVTLLQDVLKSYFKVIPYETNHSFGLYKDLTPSDPQIIAAGAGAVQPGDLWYQGWTLPNTMDFPLGDSPNAGAPTAALTRTGGNLDAPANFTLNATASDADGISSLEILKGDIVLASSTTGTVAFDVANAASGSYTYTVRAVDNHPFSKLTTTQNLVVAIANPAPAVGLTRTGEATLVGPAAFTLNATASDADGIASLEILEGETVLGTNISTTLSVNLTGVTPGNHTYIVRAKDNNGDQKTTTQELLVVVAEPPPNVDPTVALTRTGATLISPAEFTLNATATDPDGAITSLQILEGDVVLGGSNTGTLSVPVAGKPAGVYTYTVKATDNHSPNPKTVTGTLIVNVFEPPTAENSSAPTVSLTLANNDSLVAPAAFSLIATADDANDIDTLQVLVNDSVVASGPSPLVVPVTGKDAGSYTYTLRAKDKHPTDPKDTTKTLVVVVNAAAVNEAPTLSFIRSGADTLYAPGSFTLHALAGDPQGIDTLQITLLGEVVGTSTNGALSIQLSGLAAGTYKYIARAKDKHAASPKETTEELTVEILQPIPTVIAPLRDLDGIASVGSRGHALLLDSKGSGPVKLALWDLYGHSVWNGAVNLSEGENLIDVGNKRGVHFLRISDGLHAAR